MKIYYEATLKKRINDIHFYDLEVELSNGDTLVLDWDEGDYGQPQLDTNNHLIIAGRMKGIMFNPAEGDYFYANGHLRTLSDIVSLVGFSYSTSTIDEIIEEDVSNCDSIIFNKLIFIDGKDRLTITFDKNGIAETLELETEEDTIYV